MTKKELVDRLHFFNNDSVVIISDGNGWCNIEKIEQQDHSIVLLQEKYPIFSDN